MIVNHLSAVMGARRLSILEVTRRTGLAYGTVWPLYHDKAQRIGFGTLDALCRALRCQVGDLLEYAPDPEPVTPASPEDGRSAAPSRSTGRRATTRRATRKEGQGGDKQER